MLFRTNLMNGFSIWLVYLLLVFSVFPSIPVFSADLDQHPQPISAVTLGSVLVHPSREAPAVAMTLNDTRLAAEIAGVVISIDVEVGERVSKDQVVARINCEPHRIEVVRARAAMEAGRSRYSLSKLQLKNAVRLDEKGSISVEELDKRAAEAKTLEAELQQLQAALANAVVSETKCAILTPIDAVVIERIASRGDYAVPGTPILRLLDDQHIEISANVQEQDLSSLKKARETFFTTRDRRYRVRLRTVIPLIDTRLRTYEVRLTFSGDEKAPPGATGRLNWVVGQGQVPVELIVRRDGKLGIFVVEEGRAAFVHLASAQAGHPAPTDLPPSAQVIVDGRLQLEDGDSVRLP